LFVVALIFVYRSFYCMRIPEEQEQTKPARATVSAQKELAASKQ
jgi:hypothetical protein